MEQRQHLRLRLGTQIDEQVAAGHQVEAREGWVGQDVLDREHDNTPQLERHTVAVLLLRKEAGEQGRRHIRRDRFRIDAFARECNRVRIDIGGKDLELDGAFCRRDLIEKKHGKRVGLLTRAASRHPDSERPILRLQAHEIGNDFRRQQLENLGVAEEAGDVDEEIYGEEFELAGIFAQEVEISVAVRHRGQCHASLDPARQRPRLVEREVVRGLGAQKRDDLCQAPGRRIAWLVAVETARGA